MMLVVLLSLAAPAPSGAAATAVRSDDPPVKVWLNQDNYRRGDKAHVNIRLGEDGYLVVLRADANRRVRVLFPLDPGDDAFVRGGETREIQGRGDREAFSIDEHEGSGLVLAARSVTPFTFDEFARGDHWDYRVLTGSDAGDDQEQALLDIVQRMVPGGHVDYDAVNYTVASPRTYYDGAYSPRSEEHTSELQSQSNLVCRLLLEKKKNKERELTVRLQATSIDIDQPLSLRPADADCDQLVINIVQTVKSQYVCHVICM